MSTLEKMRHRGEKQLKLKEERDGRLMESRLAGELGMTGRPVAGVGARAAAAVL